ncbi:MAG: redox-regulated ATPase YchF [Anaerolineales bacterium]|nr:redox-regulated ATPase YchF [Anaerolineales bacterium]
MKLGIIGLPSSGKTTIFNALTKGDNPTGQSMGGRFDVLSAMVDVPDERVDRLSAMFNPKKTTYARVTYSDIAGLTKGIGESGGLGGPLLNHLAQVDGYVHVIRAFESEMVPHPDGAVDPMRDLEALDTEFLLYDMVQVESKLERIADGLRRGATKDKAAAAREEELFTRLQATLAEEKPLRAMELTDEEEKSLRGYGLLSLKPVLVLINLGDDQQEIDIAYDWPNSRLCQLHGRLEAELAQLTGDDLEMFMEEYGVTELGLDLVIRLSYDLMGLHSFFTVGEDEVRAWTIPLNATAVEAAGTIHSDLAKGFIRAETVHYDDLLEAGSMAAVKHAGKFRQEGKTYIVVDGDIINVKFNI